MSKFARAASLVLTLLLIAGLSQAQKPKEHPEFVVSTAWLADHLTDPKLVIIQIGSPDDYKEGHIPGARYLLANKFVVQQGTELPPVDQLKAAFEGAGISDDSRVLVYTTGWGPQATRLIFTLNYVGFDNVALLDGGFDKWAEEKRPISMDVPAEVKGSLTIHARPEIVATLDDVKHITAAPAANTVVIDARPLRRFRQGHLSGAAPLFWEHNLVDPDATAQVLKSPAELRKMYAAAGVTPGKKVVSYCEVGWQATYAYFIARYLGYDAQMYDGSYDEWTKQKQPTVRGDSAR